MSKHNRMRRIKASNVRGSTPSALQQIPLNLRELPPSAEHQRLYINETNDYLRCYSLGECSVLVTKEFGRWHLSIAHPNRNPTWREISEARYRVIPNDALMAMLLPPIEQYVNIHRHCFQMIEIDEPQVAPEYAPAGVIAPSIG